MKTDITLERQSVKIETREREYFYSYDEIAYIICERPYSEIYCIKGGETKKYLVCISLSKIEIDLPPIFFRCNQSTIINIRFLKSFDKKNNILFMDGAQFSLSFRNISLFKKHRKFLDKIYCHCTLCNLYGKKCTGYQFNFCSKSAE
jgi:DNA-binding LytR/AlgR family response regulator